MKTFLTCTALMIASFMLTGCGGDKPCPCPDKPACKCAAGNCTCCPACPCGGACAGKAEKAAAKH